MMKDSVLTGF